MLYQSKLTDVKLIGDIPPECKKVFQKYKRINTPKKNPIKVSKNIYNNNNNIIITAYQKTWIERVSAIYTAYATNAHFQWFEDYHGYIPKNEFLENPKHYREGL